ncbi:MAG: hypothetical protein LBC21_04215, partial [Oscillospiraceae bacterium]|nr:hypothetical protein [Oscillospiraceae bacterium]
MKKEFKPPMTARERLAAMLFIPMHAFIVPLLLSAAFPHLAREGTGALLTLVSYTVSFVYILIIAFNYLRASFSDIFDGLWAAIRSVALGMLIYFGSNIAINIFLNAIIDKLVNPNSQAVAELLVAEPDS